MSPEESLRIIDRILQQTRASLGDSRFAILFWGYFIVALSLIHYGLAWLGIPNPWLGWMLTPLGWVVMVWYHRKRDNGQPVNRKIGKMFTVIWAVMGVNLALIGFFGYHYFGSAFVAVLLFGISWGALATGAILDFRPLIIGAVLSNLIAIAALVAVPFEFHLLLCALTAMCCNIIPGHLLGSDPRN